MKRIFLIPIVLFLSSCNFYAQEIPYVKITKVINQKTENNVYQGYIKKSSDIELGFNLSGILTLRKKEGDFVKKGEIIAKLDSDEYELRVERAKLELENAKILNSRAKSYFERISKLYQAGGISYNDWEAAQTDLKSSANKIEMLKDAVKIASKQENYTKIEAPYDGIIIKTYKDPHQFVLAGEKIFYFQGDSETVGRIFVSQKDIGNIKLGQDVIIKADIAPDKIYKGKIKTKINSSLNKGSYEVKILFNENHKELLDGMSITAEIDNKDDKNAFFVPLTSVLNEGNKKFVYIFEKSKQNEGFIYKKEIATGNISNDYIEIKEGLIGDENIVEDSLDKIRDKTVVKVYE